MTDQMWDDPTPTYRPNWRDRARWAREAAESDARAQEAPGQGSDAEETGEGAVSGVEALARVLFQWNTPDDPYFVIKGRYGEVGERDPYIPIVEAILADPGPLLAALSEAGVLTEERAIDRPGRRGINPQRRYVSEWRPADD